jgi:hypothetical protein
LDSSFELLETPIPASVTLFKNPRQMFHGEDEKSNPNPVNLINKPDLLCQEEDSRLTADPTEGISKTVERGQYQCLFPHVSKNRHLKREEGTD